MISLRATGTAAAALLATACSLLVQSNAVQCTVDQDCAIFDAGGAPIVCIDTVCVGPGVGGPCQTNTDCVTRNAGMPATCRNDTHQCVPLLSPNCPTVYGDYQSNDAIVLGSVLSLTGMQGSSGVFEVQSAELALDDFANTIVGLPAGADGKPRPLVLVECDDTGDNTVATQAATHLVNDIGVPAILGPDASGLCTAVINNVTIPAKVLLISPAATSATLSGISPYFWRTSPSDDIQAVPLGLSVGEIATAHSLAPIKLAVLYKSDTYGTGLYTTVTSTLQINGAPVGAPQNSGNFSPVEYMADGSNIAAGAAQIVAFQPNLIALFGTNEVISGGLDAIEASWPAGPARPFYLVSDGGEAQELLNEITTNPGLRTRVRGTVPGTNSALFQAFSLEYQGKYGSPAEVFGMAGSYDSIYLLGYAITSAGTGSPLDGTAIANGMAKMIGGTPINVGVGDMQSAVTTLTGGNAIAIDGASGPLHFDLMTHEAPSDIEVWCVGLDGSSNPQFVSSGRSYDATSGMMVGTFNCP